MSIKIIRSLNVGYIVIIKLNTKVLRFSDSVIAI